MKSIENQRTLMHELNTIRKSLATLEQIPDTDHLFKNLVYTCMVTVGNLHAYHVKQLNEFGKEIAQINKASINVHNNVKYNLSQLDEDEIEQLKVLMQEAEKIQNEAKIRNKLLGN
ncbi:hypothetical protein KZP23_07530 [Echinicola marina]|uniref:hypothetical protein n=1 Tax=Echinicola marina TaxID=2859768 RepID=UPI001CF6864A|nr:hypothetical protein [Echinicola marina]UCS94851.1 hypothetical protein KZP23_07530 [Echinicola marina]